MNKFLCTGRLTKAPDFKDGGKNGTSYARFNIALNRGKSAKGEDLGADFPSVVAFGNLAELCDKYLDKGSKIAIEGSIRTGSYEDKKGNTVYTTDVIAERIEFLDSKNSK